MAGQEGLEPPTPGFGVRCSTIRATGLHKENRFPKTGLYFNGGDDGIRTHDLGVANATLSQLSYIPWIL